MRELLKMPLRLLVPPAVRGWIKRKMLGEKYTPGIGSVRFGDLRRVTPICPDFGHGRGGAIDRVYVENFLDANRADIRGKVLEIGDRVYTQRFGGNRVTQSDVLHAVAGNPAATIVGDLQTGENVPVGEYDCMIVTQAIHVLFDFRAALRHCLRTLKPGGVLLMTTPGITQQDLCTL
jgi:SAM-dependent methyltransferase